MTFADEISWISSLFTVALHSIHILVTLQWLWVDFCKPLWMKPTFNNAEEYLRPSSQMHFSRKDFFLCGPFENCLQKSSLNTCIPYSIPLKPNFKKKEFLLLIFEGLPLCTRNGILGNILLIQNDFFRYEKCTFLTIKCYGDFFGDNLVRIFKKWLKNRRIFWRLFQHQGLTFFKIQWE